jgi:carbon-monoxide dehydrogenase small subunit
MFAWEAEDKSVLTIEGLAERQAAPDAGRVPRKSRTAVRLRTPGMIMTAVDRPAQGQHLDDKTIREELEGNICRCTGYHNIVKPPPARRQWHKLPEE